MTYNSPIPDDFPRVVVTDQRDQLIRDLEAALRSIERQIEQISEREIENRGETKTT